MAIPNPNNLKFRDFKAQKKAELKKAREAASKKRQEAKDKREAAKNALEEQTNNVQNNSEKGKGLAKLTPVILKYGTQITVVMAPAIISLIQETLSEALGDELTQAQNNLAELACPSQKVTQSTILKLNGIIDNLNNISDSITKIVDIAEATSDILQVTQAISTALKYSIPPVSIAAKSTPLIPGFIVSILDDLDWINNNLLYTNAGVPRIPIAIAGINGISASTGIISLSINKVVTLIQPFIEYLERCSGPVDYGSSDENNNYTLNSLSPDTLNLSKLGNNNFQSQDPVSYNGFIIKVEEVPFTPTVNRYQAVGYNVYNIPMIKGELSFSPNALILVEELKFYIDQNNLKAY